MNTKDGFEWIGSLRSTEQNCLEALVTEFTVQRLPENKGFSLKLEFNPESQALWHRRGKEEVQKKIIADFAQKSVGYGAKLGSFFFENNGNEYKHADNSFPFRYCSGGALPIITIEGKHYYRLHWRDIHPVGWNITNGGSDSIAEMLDPARIIKRELCEELVIFDLKENEPRRLVLGEQSLNEDAFPSESWRKWHKRLVEQERSELKIEAFTNEVLPCGWLRGPDKLAVTYRDTSKRSSLPRRSDGFFLNINAEDFGIEMDRVVRIELPKTAVICDGELISGHLLNSPIGLFEVEAMHEAIRSNSTDFRPSILFFDAEVHYPDDLEAVIESFLEGKKRNNLLPEVEINQLREAENQERKFDLCPVSRTLIRRCMKLTTISKSVETTDDIDVFISFASEDQAQAQDIYDWLTQQGRFPVFFSPESIRDSDFSNAIFSALERAKNLIVVGSRLDHLRKNWVSFEYQSFFIKKMNDKNRKRELFTVLSELPVTVKLPAPLETYKIISYSKDTMQQNLQELLESLG